MSFAVARFIELWLVLLVEVNVGVCLEKVGCLGIRILFQIFVIFPR